LARALVALVESEGWGWTSQQRAQDTRLVEITQSALAAHVGATHESINKWLGYYERRGCISRKRDSLVVLRLDELRSLSGVEWLTRRHTRVALAVRADGHDRRHMRRLVRVALYQGACLG